MSTVTVDVAATAHADTVSALVQEIRLDQIKPSKANPRRRTDDSAMAELAASIRTHGVLQPILVQHIWARETGGTDETNYFWKLLQKVSRETLRRRLLLGNSLIPWDK